MGCLNKLHMFDASMEELVDRVGQGDVGECDHKTVEGGIELGKCCRHFGDVLVKLVECES